MSEMISCPYCMPTAPIISVGAKLVLVLEILTLTMFTPESSVSSSQIRCTNCDYEEPEVDGNTNYAISAQEAAASMSKWIAGLGHEVSDPCPECMFPMTCDIFFKDTPIILSLEYPNQH